MVSNIQCVGDFLNRKVSSAHNLISTGSKLISYSTCIGEFKGGYLYINRDKYSVTTSKHQSYLNRLSTLYHYTVIFVNNIEIGTYNLC